MWWCKQIWSIFALLSIQICNGMVTGDKPCFLQPLEEIANKMLYFAVDFRANFYEASNFCRAHCMNLVSINSEAEHNGIVRYLKNCPYNKEDIWTSGNDLGDEGMFTWLSTGNRMIYTNWKDRPNISDGNCVHLGGKAGHYKWNQAVCYSRFYFICEIKL